MHGRRAWWVTLVLQVVLLPLTFLIPGIGTELWHHVLTLGFTIGILAALNHPFRTSRAFLGTHVLLWSILASLSGFLLLYTKETIRPLGLQDWGVWWHIWWSWFAMAFFFQHTWINRKQYVLFFRNSFKRILPGLAHGLLYGALVIGFIVTWFTAAKGTLTQANYIAYSLVAWAALGLVVYLGFLVRDVRGTTKDQQRRMRRGMDLVLVPIAAVTILSGFPLLLIGDTLDANGLKYMSKFWHVWPSVAFSIIVFVHAVQTWTSMRQHLRKEGIVRVDRA